MLLKFLVEAKPSDTDRQLELVKAALATNDVNSLATLATFVKLNSPADQLLKTVTDEKVRSNWLTRSRRSQADILTALDKERRTTVIASLAATPHVQYSAVLAAVVNAKVHPRTRILVTAALAKNPYLTDDTANVFVAKLLDNLASREDLSETTIACIDNIFWDIPSDRLATTVFNSSSAAAYHTSLRTASCSDNDLFSNFTWYSVLESLAYKTIDPQLAAAYFTLLASAEDNEIFYDHANVRDLTILWLKTVPVLDPKVKQKLIQKATKTGSAGLFTAAISANHTVPVTLQTQLYKLEKMLDNAVTVNDFINIDQQLQISLDTFGYNSDFDNLLIKIWLRSPDPAAVLYRLYPLISAMDSDFGVSILETSLVKVTPLTDVTRVASLINMGYFSLEDNAKKLQKLNVLEPIVLATWQNLPQSSAPQFTHSTLVKWISSSPVLAKTVFEVIPVKYLLQTQQPALENFYKHNNVVLSKAFVKELSKLDTEHIATLITMEPSFEGTLAQLIQTARLV